MLVQRQQWSIGGAALDHSQKTSIGSKRAESLLYPIAAFLLTGGLSRVAAEKAFNDALVEAQKIAGRRIEHIGHPLRYADVIALWSHDVRFVDRLGHPRALRMNGKHEFRSLIASVDPKLNYKILLSVLKRYGNVRKTRDGRYALVRPFFFTSTRKSMAFEPMAYFLSDASSTLGRILKRTKSSRAPELFWRKVEATGLSKSAAVEFTEFVATRSLEFLEELDDWLEARRTVATQKGRAHHLRRVGIGLFSIYSNPEAITQSGSAP
jgi:hypothetical protein